MRDSYNREIYYLRISVTEKCDLACRYCREGESSVHECGTGEGSLSFGEIIQVARAAAEQGFSKVRLTGGEPLLRAGLPTLVRMIKNVEGITFVGMTTNGTKLARFAGALKEAGLDGVNVSLDTLDPEQYRSITGGGDIDKVLAGLDAAVREGFAPIKINMVVNDTTSSDENETMMKFCEARGFILQRIREYRLDHRDDTNHEYERPLRCGDCNRLRLTADGRLLPCLHADEEVPVDFADIAGSLDRAIRLKPPAGVTRSNSDISIVGG